MRIGIFLVGALFPGQTSGEVLRNTVETVVAAERAGFDDAWLAEHHFMSYGVIPSAVTLAGVALGRTSRIRVGTAVSVLSTRHPVALAEEAAILHHASGGRFELGVGRGGPWVDLEVFGTGLPRFERGFAESLDLLCAALTRESVSADGEFFRFREVPVTPSPPGLRPVVACTSAQTADLAAARGLPMLLGLHVGDEEKAAMLARHSAAGEKAATLTLHSAAEGVSPSTATGVPADHIGAAVGFVADTTDEAVAELKRAMPRWLRPGLAGYVPVDGRPRPARDVDAYVDLLCRIHPVGSPEHCVGVLRETIRRTGLTRLILLVEGAGDHRRTLENVARLGREVLPLMRT
ncbi:LLM class flavin-dependent oxidoreductase [Herbidospora galbida]|uniref:LLM class flavin-dependent oxidoreductase n=1 Tax=Herbidospora galbida TaxID=2575442 RepID=A0A4U3MEN5_9ACTN|nr:LLM class flavin-dependent oxidoreductase [Herbidospora galbida]TKK86327.1 LLM class flavin-dependent oxidoreductase [Herbidospora galbida]